MLSVVGAALACAVSVVATATAATSAAAVVPFERACAAAPAGQFSCLARVAPALAPPTGLGAVPYAPVSIKAAYGMNTSPFAGAGQTIAIVDAFDNDRVVSDLAAFDNHYGLPLCNKPNGCFNKVNQNGGTGSFPPPNKGWAQEIALDVEWAHAIAPGAKILFVEA